MSSQDTHEILLKHFEDDRNAFEKIDKCFDKMQEADEKFAEINRQNGEHFSHFNSLLVQLKRSIEEHRDESKKHRERVEPMLLAYEDNQATGRTFKKWGGRLFFAAAAVGAVIAIKNFIINSFVK